MTFCLICCRKVRGEASFDNRACGSGDLSNSLGGANARYIRVARAVSTYHSSEQVVVCCLQTSCFTNPQRYFTAGNKTGSKSPINYCHALDKR